MLYINTYRFLIFTFLFIPNAFANTLSIEKLQGRFIHNEDDSYYKRLFIKRTNDGYYLVQDFYIYNNKIRTESFILKNKKDLLGNKFIYEKLTVMSDKFIAYYDSGHLWIQGNYKNGLADGIWTYWYPDNGKWSEQTYQEGGAVGKSIYWYMNGNKLAEGEFKLGQPNGQWLFWNEEGKLQDEFSFKNNQLKID